jgi:hypothetical protein
MKGDLLELNKAREASETCVRALPQFIRDNDVGVEKSTASIDQAVTYHDLRYGRGTMSQSSLHTLHHLPQRHLLEAQTPWARSLEISSVLEAVPAAIHLRHPSQCHVLTHQLAMTAICVLHTLGHLPLSLPYTNSLPLKTLSKM